MSDADSYTGADLFVDTLEQYGVEYLFGNPGTTELPILVAMEDSSIEYVLGLHEDAAVGMAAGYSSTSRYHYHSDPESGINPVGVVNLHLAPGVAHGLGNLLNADFQGVPLVVTAGNHDTDFRHEEPILSGDAVEMTEQFTKWSAEVLDVDTLPTMLARAFRVSLTPPTGPVFLALPRDVMMAETDAQPQRLGPIPDAGRGDPSEVDRAVDLLVGADRPVMVVGDGVARSGTKAIDAAVELSEAIGARVHAEMLAAEVNFPPTHDQWVSHLPASESGAGPPLNTDTVLLVGCSTNTTVNYRVKDLIPRETNLVHVSDDPWQLGKNHHVDAAVIGDPGLVLSEMSERVASRISESELDSRRATVREAKERFGPEAEAEADDSSASSRLSKSELVKVMREIAPEALIVDESLTSKYVMLSGFEPGPEQRLGNKGGGLGYSLPGAVGAAIAESRRSDPRTVIGFIGDGSFLYYPNAVYSAVRYDIDLTVVIPDNRNYRILKDNTLAFFGGDEDDYEFLGMDFEPPVNIPTIVEGYGGEGLFVESSSEFHDTLADAIERDGLSVVDVLVRDE